MIRHPNGPDLILSDPPVYLDICCRPAYKQGEICNLRSRVSVYK
jgi:hypothetical protein